MDAKPYENWLSSGCKSTDWELRRKNEVLQLRVKGRLLTSDSGTLIGACEAGFGIAQVIEIGNERLLRSGRLVELFPGWSEERFPLYAIFPTRLHRAAKVRAFIDFVMEILESDAA